MKMSKGLQATLRDEITIKVLNHLDFPVFRMDYENGNIKNAEKTEDLNKRFRWDIFWLINFYKGIRTMKPNRV